MAGMLRVPRSRGALTGVLLVLLGVWGALIPFVGPYFHYAYTPDTAWLYNSGRLWLEVVPGAATILGGLLLLTAAVRPVGLFGAALAAVAGAWFTVGTLLTPLWAGSGVGTAGLPVGGTLLRAVEQIGFFYGLGVAIVFVAAVAIGRLSAVTVRDTRYAESRAAAMAAEAEPATDVPAPRQPA
jgi:hypothetical protein